MTTIGALTVNVAASTGQLEAGLKSARKTMTKFTREIRGELEDLGSWSSSRMKWLAGGIAAGLGLAVKSYVTAEDSTNRLRLAMDAGGAAAGHSVEEYVKLAEQLQYLTGLDDEYIKDLMRQNFQMGVTGEQMAYVTESAIGLSYAMGIDAVTAQRAFMNATLGNFMTLQRLIPKIREGKDNTEKLKIVTDLAASGFLQMQARTDTLAGGWLRLKNVCGDLLETIGKKFLDEIGNTATAFGWLVEKVMAAAFWIRDLNKTQISIAITWAKWVFGILGFLMIVPKVISAIAALAHIYTVLAAAKALANPALAVAGIAAAVGVGIVGSKLHKLGQETEGAFAGSWDSALGSAREQIKGYTDTSGFAAQRATGDQWSKEAMAKQLEMLATQKEIAANTRKAKYDARKRPVGRKFDRHAYSTAADGVVDGDDPERDTDY